MARKPATAAASTVYIGLLKDIAVAANEASTPQSALEATLRSVCHVTGWPVGHVLLLTATGELESMGLWHVTGREHLDEGLNNFRIASEARRFKPGDGLPGRVLASGPPAWTIDARVENDFPRRSLAQGANLASSFAFPVRAGSETVAMLEFYTPHPQAPSAELLDVMAHIGVQLGRVFERQAAERALTVREQRSQ